MDLAEHTLAQDARVHQTERELAVRAREDEAEDPLVPVPPLGQELRDGWERRRHAASYRVLSRERDHLDEVRVPEGSAAAFPQAVLHEVEELVLPRDPFGSQDEEVAFHGLRHGAELVGHLAVNRPGFLRGLQEILYGEVPTEMGADSIREVVGLVHDQDEIGVPAAETGAESLEVLP